MFLAFDFLMICTDVVVAPPFLYIDQVKNSLTDRIEISGQNSWVGKGGAFTGEIRFVYSALLNFLVVCPSQIHTFSSCYYKFIFGCLDWRLFSLRLILNLLGSRFIVYISALPPLFRSSSRIIS